MERAPKEMMISGYFNKLSSTRTLSLLTQDLVELTFRRSDVDGDGQISERDYLRAAARDPLWTDILCPCLLTSTTRGLAFMKRILDTPPGNRIYQE